MAETPSPEALGSVSTSFREAIHKAKTGSIPHLRQLQASIPQSYEDHGVEILGATLQHLKVPTQEEKEGEDGERATQHVAVATASIGVLVEIARWPKSQERRTPAAISTSLQLFSASKDYTACILHHLLTADLLELCGTVALLFDLLFEANPRLLSTVARLPAMLDIALAFWSVIYHDSPLIYPAGKPPNSDPFVDEEGDRGLAVFYKLTVENPGGMAEAVMDGRLISPQVFASLTVNRIGSLDYIFQSQNATHRGNQSVEIGNARYIILSTDSLLKIEPQLRRLLLAKSQYPGTFIHALASMSTRVYESIPPGRGQAAEAHVRYLMLTVELAECVVNWVATSSTNIIHNMRRLIDSGAFHIMANALPFLSDQRQTKIDGMFRTIEPYALYSRTLRIWLTAMTSLITPQLMNIPGMGYRKGSFGTTLTWIHPYQSFLEKGAESILCDNLKHCDRVGQGPNITPSAGERLCARCRSVAYCSRECQLEDWRSFHRSECPALSRRFYDHDPSKGQYRYRYRKLHANILRYGFESAELTLRCMHVPGSSTGYDPLKVQTHVELLWEDPDVQSAGRGLTADGYARAASPLIPPCLRPRFDSLLSTFQHWSTRAGRPDTRRLAPRTPGPHTVGSLRLVERPFRFGEVDIMMLLLLEQVKPLSTVTGTLLEKDARLSEFLRRGAGAEPSYEIVGSLTYTVPRRTYRHTQGGAADDMFAAFAENTPLSRMRLMI